MQKLYSFFYSDKSNSANMLTLPEEILVKIFSYLTVTQLFIMAMVCQETKRISEDDRFWKRRLPVGQLISNTKKEYREFVFKMKEEDEAILRIVILGKDCNFLKAHITEVDALPTKKGLTKNYSRKLYVNYHNLKGYWEIDSTVRMAHCIICLIDMNFDYSPDELKYLKTETILPAGHFTSLVTLGYYDSRKSVCISKEDCEKFAIDTNSSACFIVDRNKQNQIDGAFYKTVKLGTENFHHRRVFLRLEENIDKSSLEKEQSSCLLM